VKDGALIVQMIAAPGQMDQSYFWRRETATGWVKKYSSESHKRF